MKIILKIIIFLFIQKFNLGILGILIIFRICFNDIFMRVLIIIVYMIYDKDYINIFFKINFILIISKEFKNKIFIFFSVKLKYYIKLFHR